MMRSVTSASSLRRVMLVLAAAALLVVMRAFSAAPAMAEPAVAHPAEPAVAHPADPVIPQPLFEQPIVPEQTIFNPGSAGFTDFDHMVQPGENLSGIAADLGTTHDVLAAENGLQNPHLIFPGQVLRHQSS
jgi:nucleoid-associated protein YgaU